MKYFFQFLLIAFVCFSFSGLLSACKSSNTTPAAGTSAQGSSLGLELTPSAAATPSADESHRVIVHALLLLNTTPNRFANTTVAADGSVQQNVIESIPPDRKRIVGDGTELIVVGGKVYLKTSADDPWQEIDIPASTYLGEPLSTEAAVEAYVEGGEFVRSDMLDGRPVGIFRYGSSTVASGINLHNQTELWVGQADGLPYKMVIDGETLKVSLDPASGENKASAEKALSTCLIVFDASLKIEAPQP